MSTVFEIQIISCHFKVLSSSSIISIYSNYINTTLQTAAILMMTGERKVGQKPLFYKLEQTIEGVTLKI